MMEYSYTIIDSDVSSNLRLQTYLDEYGDFLYLGQAQNSADGLNSILKHLPDVVFIHLNDKALDYFQMITELYQYVKNIPVLIGFSNSARSTLTKPSRIISLIIGSSPTMNLIFGRLLCV